MHLVTLTFAGESYDVAGFGDWVVGSDWLTAVGRDYGVGHGTHVAHLASDAGTGPTVDDSAIQAFLSGNVQSGALPAPDAQTIYLLVFPSGTLLTNPTGTSCSNWLGYHSSFSANGHSFLYAVVPTCPGGEAARASFSWSVIASHELVETATDPGGSSWTLDAGAWTAMGAEDGDLCRGKYFQSDAGYLVQRMWSNSAAAQANASPCVPFPPGEVYFNLSAQAVASGSGDFEATVSSSGAAQHVTFEVTAWSTAPDTFVLGLSQLAGPPISVSVPSSGGMPLSLQNASTFQLIVTLPAGTPSADIDLALLASDDGFVSQNIAPLLIHLN